MLGVAVERVGMFLQAIEDVVHDPARAIEAGAAVDEHGLWQSEEGVPGLLVLLGREGMGLLVEGWHMRDFEADLAVEVDEALGDGVPVERELVVGDEADDGGDAEFASRRDPLVDFIGGHMVFGAGAEPGPGTCGK